jgi:hypothetical protein
VEVCAEDETIPDVIYVCAWKGSDMRHLERGICVATGDGAAGPLRLAGLDGTWIGRGGARDPL